MMAGIAAKARENKKRCDKEYLQWARLFADFLASGEKGSESVRKKGGQWGISAESARCGGVQGRKTIWYLNSRKYVHE
jgi:hypothetical protein